jgi:hypothetical protein
LTENGIILELKSLLKSSWTLTVISSPRWHMLAELLIIIGFPLCELYSRL